MILGGQYPLGGPLEGVGPGNLDFFGTKWHSVPFHFRPNKVSISNNCTEQLFAKKNVFFY
jgi:hypothetical protein